jgi:Leucine-rich repeat (LRR) protein
MNFLTNLKLSDNKLAAAKIEHFHNLKDFNIEGNRLESVNFECYGLHNLAKFNCSKNSLTNLEKSFASTSTAQSWGGLMQVVPQFRVAMYVSTLYNFTQQLARSGNLATTFDAITQQ